MRTFRLPLLVCALTLGVAAAAEFPYPILPVSEVKPGMTGYGLSVFRGTAVSRFDIEVIDILPKADLDGDWIMIKITSGPVAERNTGVVKGMSGSPVYIDEKLVGAVAYGFAMPTENVAFLTPIENMLRVLDASEHPLPPTRLARRTVALRRPVEIGGAVRSSVEILDRPAPDGYSAGPATLVAEPLMTPMVLSGLGPRGVQAVSSVLAPYGLVSVAGPTGGQRDGLVDLQPGSAVGVALVSGDVTAVSTGTVTARVGDRILAFGHPMFQRNRVSLPLTGAYVVDIWASRQASSKVTAALDVIGTLTEDGHWGIVAEVGREPDTIPFRLTIRDLDRGQTKTVNCRIADDELLAPNMALAIPQGVVADWLGVLPRSTVVTRTRVELAGYEPLLREEVATLEGSVEQAVIADLLGAAQVALNNPYGRLSLAAVEMDVEVTREDTSAVIDRAYIDQATVEPGDTLRVELDIRRRADGEIFRRTLLIPVPEEALPGKTRVAIAGGLGEPGMNGQLKLLVPPADNTDQLVEQFRGLDTRNRTIVAKLALMTNDLSLRGYRYPNPPANFAGLQGQAGTTDLSVGFAEVRVEEPLDLVILNGASAPLTIAAPGAAEGAGNGAEQKAVEILPGLPVTRLAGAAESLFAPPAWAAEAVPLVDFPLDLAANRLRRNTDQPPGRATAGESAPAESPAAAPQGEQPKPPATVNSRDPRIWVQNSPADFSGGTLDGTAVDPDGALVLSVSGEQVAVLPEPIVGGAARAADGSLYLATANNGQLFRLRDGALEVIWKGDQPVLTTVAAVGDEVWFATAPDGVVRKLTAGGAETVVETGAAYVWQILPTDEGVLVATGEPAGVWRLVDGALTPLWQGGGHILCLALGSDGAVYAGGSPNGRILALADGRVSQPVRAADEVTALAVAGDGTLYYGSGGQVGMLQPNGQHRLTPALGGPAILGLQVTEAGLLASVRAAQSPNQASLWMLQPEAGEGRRLFATDSVAISALVRDGGDLLAVTSAPAAVHRLRVPHGDTGAYESKILDAQLVSGWGAVEVGSRLPDGAAVELETRTGNTPQPGDDWSGWIAATRRVHSPAGRYLQYRVRLTAAEGRSPILDWLRFHYAALNQAPLVQLEQPQLGTAWRGDQEVSWKITDANGDQPLVTVLLRRVGTETWKPLAVEVPAGAGKVPLKTSEHEDGRYQLRIIADDGVFNPDLPLTGERLSDPFVIDNTAPEIQLPPPDGFRLVAGRVEATFTARDNMALAGAEWRFGTDGWRPAVADDGLFDSDAETIRLRTGRLTPGQYTLEIRVRDTAGNEATVRHGIVLNAPAQ